MQAAVSQGYGEPDPDGLFEGSYTNLAGTLCYKLYRPAKLRQGAPLFVMLHGCSQSAADFAIGTRMNEVADECGGVVLYPEQSKSANMLGCWNWYDTKHQLADGGEPAIIAGMTRQIVADHDIDADRVYVAGMSAGGAMAVILGQAYPELYAAVGVHSGVPCGVARDFMSGLSAMNRGPVPLVGEAAARQRDQGPLVATIVFHGDRDSTVHPSNGEALLAHARRRSAVLPDPGVALSGTPMVTACGRAVTRTAPLEGDDMPASELWVVHGGGHAWTGGDPRGSFTDEHGPDASREMLRFFLRQRLPGSASSTSRQAA